MNRPGSAILDKNPFENRILRGTETLLQFMRLTFFFLTKLTLLCLLSFSYSMLIREVTIAREMFKTRKTTLVRPGREGLGLRGFQIVLLASVRVELFGSVIFLTVLSKIVANRGS